jgi:hypothetical protein
MEITDEIIHKSVAQVPFGNFEPFITGNDDDATKFYSKVVEALECLSGISVVREDDHHGQGYASYVSVFLYPADGSTQRDCPKQVETTGILLYMSRLAPIAVYAASQRAKNKYSWGGNSGFIEANSVNTAPEGDWDEFVWDISECLHSFQVEILPREMLLVPLPEGIKIPTLFDGPYYVFDALFYWCD